MALIYDVDINKNSVKRVSRFYKEISKLSEKYQIEIQHEDAQGSFLYYDIKSGDIYFEGDICDGI